MMNRIREGEFALPLTLRLWGRLTTWRVMHQELGTKCSHDGTGQMCTRCTFALEGGVWFIADFAP